MFVFSRVLPVELYTLMVTDVPLDGSLRSVTTTRSSGSSLVVVAGAVSVTTGFVSSTVTSQSAVGSLVWPATVPAAVKAAVPSGSVCAEAK